MDTGEITGLKAANMPKDCCKEIPCKPNMGMGIIRKAASFGAKGTFAAGLVYYSAHFGLWGSQEETQMFFSNIYDTFGNLFNK